jgi:hypothetical protein
MPSTVIRHGLGQTPMVSYRSASGFPQETIIAPTSLCAVGVDLVAAASGNFVSATYPATNRALGFMFCLGDYFLVRKVWWSNGTTATTDNADVAVYTEDGATRLVAAGATLIATANVLQEVDVTDTLLAPGRYWCVYNQNGVTATPIMSPAVAATLRAIGCAQFAGAVPLGTAFTPAAVAAANFPYFGIASRTQVA